MTEHNVMRVMGVAATIVAVGVAGWFLPDYYLGLAVKALIYIGLAVAWNLIGGFAGQLSLGHSVFIAIGALLPSALLLKEGVNFWAGMAIAAIVSALLGAVISWIAFRFRLGHLYFALITLAFAELGWFVIIGTEYLGGASGFFLASGPMNLARFEFATTQQYFVVAFMAVLAAIGLSAWIFHSKLGYYLRAIRNNEDAAQAIGINLLACKVVVMVISAALSSVIGSIYARFSGFVDPNLFASPLIIIEIVLFTAIGGIGTVWGPVVGAGLLVPLGEVLRGHLGNALPGLHLAIYGFLIVIVILVMPGGITRGVASIRKALQGLFT
ncbi:MAG: branched-chain amino acid ABC transporter permease, partial [Hyphomicrobium sp.]|nr:branched-chain amino acid ABC transporter permease [Hyphomicrobium sp.]